MSELMHIVQLYPRELGLTGDRGNVRALEVRAQRAGVSVKTSFVGIGDALPPTPDIIVLGNGPLSAMRGVLEDLRGRRSQLVETIEAGTVVLAVGAGAELLSSELTLLSGETVATLGLLPFSVARTRERRVGYIIADAPQGRIIGFEDHASEWTLDSAAEPLGKVVAGAGSFAHPQGGRGESIRYRNCVATNVQGPVLPLNPVLTDELLCRAAERRGISYTAGAAHASLDKLAAGARAAIEKNVDAEVFTYMKV